MTDAPRIAASIVTYHSPVEEVAAAASSLLASALPVSLIVVDNASGADYAAALKGMLPSQATLCIAPRNGGFGYGHNLALLDAPAFDYYLVLNPDVEMQPGALEALVSFLKDHPEAGLVAPKVLYPDGRLQPLNKREPTVLDLVLRRALPASLQERLPILARRMERYEMRDVGYDAPAQVPFVSGCCMLFRGDVIARLGGFDERFFLYFEDADLSMRVREIAQAWYCPEAVIVHRWHRASKGNFRMLQILVRSAAQYFIKWGWRWW